MRDQPPEKGQLLNSTKGHIITRKGYSIAAYLLSVLFCVIIISQRKSFEIFTTREGSANQSEIFSPTFDWSTVKPTTELKWKPCLPNRECARLAVPLDYNVPAGEKAAIALIRIRARVLPNSQKYRGPVLFNPGGPGGSGISLVHMMGEPFQKLIGYEYDIVGFDPRGVGMTTPKVSSFTDEYERAYWDSGAPPLINSTSDSFFRAYVRSHLFGDLSVERTMHAAQHVSTATVARDMLTITRAHGRDRLQYWGFSYGTVLGATYAAMFPDHVERLVIDGVVEFEDYYAGRWYSNLYDTDKILQYFYDECASSGPACPLYANSSFLVQQRVEDIFSAIKANPLPVVDSVESDYGIVDFDLLKRGLFASLYRPFTSLVQYVSILKAVEKGDGRPLLKARRNLQQRPTCDSPPLITRAFDDAGKAIRCGEGLGASRDIAAVARHFEELSKLSVFADIWTEIGAMTCAGWKIEVKDRYNGPFNTTTSHPLLVVGNTLDPVTPLRAAKKAAADFKGAGLLTINTPGHCSLAGTSFCALLHIRNYFREGVLPAKGTVCEVEDKMFGGRPKEEGQATNPADRELLDIARELSQKFHHIRDGQFL